MRKREEKEAAEALRREQELREAKRQQQRLNFLIQQTELYSHFMQNKSNAQPSEAAELAEDVETDEQEVHISSSDAVGEEDPEEAELKKEALRAAQDAVSKQKKLTSVFDSECDRLRQSGELEPSQDVAGASNIDLHNPLVLPLVFTPSYLEFI